MGKSATKDMTAGAPLKLILQFFVPMFFGMLFQQFYNMMDTIIVGKALGVNALAAVGATGSINFMIIGFCMGVCSGFAIPVAQRFGAGDYHALRKYVANSVWLSAIFAGVMTIVVCVLCRQILLWMRTPQDIFDGAYSYIFVIFVGIPVTYLYNLLSGIIRSLGDSRSPLIFLVFSSLLNIALDLILILSFHLGVAGAAYATVISQAVSGMNTLGSTAVASVTAGSKVGMFFACPFDAMGATMTTYAGQNVGAGKVDRVGRGMKACCIIGAVYSAAAFVVLYFFGEQVSLLFVDATEQEILHNSWLFLTINAAFYLLLALVNIVRFTIQGLGFSYLAILAGVCEMAARSVVGIFFVPLIGYKAACFASPMAWLCADLFLIPAFMYASKTLKRRLQDQ